MIYYYLIIGGAIFCIVLVLFLVSKNKQPQSETRSTSKKFGGTYNGGGYG